MPVTYSLKATGDHAAFAINGSTGAVTLTATLTMSKASGFYLVIATDAAGKCLGAGLSPGNYGCRWSQPSARI